MFGFAVGCMMMGFVGGAWPLDIGTEIHRPYPTASRTMTQILLFHAPSIDGTKTQD
jgi:hypothetical protein